MGEVKGSIPLLSTNFLRLLAIRYFFNDASSIGLAGEIDMMDCRLRNVIVLLFP